MYKNAEWGFSIVGAVTVGESTVFLVKRRELLSIRLRPSYSRRLFNSIYLSRDPPSSDKALRATSLAHRKLNSYTAAVLSDRKLWEFKIHIQFPIWFSH